MFFYLPSKIYFGYEHIDEFIEFFISHKIAVLTSVGKKRLCNPIISDILERFRKAGIEYEVFDCAYPNPTYDNVQDAVRGIKEYRCTAVLAIGGGSVIDCAKAAAYQAANEKDLWYYVTHCDACTDKSLKLGVISTTAGTGSEINCCAVITKDHEKRALFCPAIYPASVLIIPEVMCSIPKEMSIFQTLDSMYHAIEGFFSKNSTAFSEVCSENCIRLCLENVDGLLKDPTDIKVRSNLCLASIYSSMADMYGGCLSAHSLGHAITAFHPEISHGMSITLIAKNYYSKMLDTDIPEIVKKKERMTALFKKYITACVAIDSQDFGLILDIFFSYLGLKKVSLSEDAEKLYINARQTVGELFENDPINLSDEEFINILKESL